MKIFRSILLFALSSVAAFEYTIYLESWDPAYASAYQGLATNPPSDFPNYNGVTMNISFAAFTFTPAAGQGTNASGLYGTYLNGSYGLQDAAVTAIRNTVHGYGGKVQIAYGGNSYAAPYYPDYFISQTAGWPGNSSTLASGVAGVVNTLGLDGVDFDIEDPQPSTSTATQFAQQLTTFLQQVRALLPSKTITLTIPAQGWGQYWQYLAQNVAAIPGLVDAINFMEYDIWVNSNLPNGYVEQVEADIITYTSPTTESPAPNWAQGWGIPASLIQLGIMPGYDDTHQLITVANSQALTQYAIDMGLPGVFIWDIDRDAQTIETPVPFYTIPAPYDYSNAIRATINATKTEPVKYSGRDFSRRSVNYTTPFVKQPNPLEGKPPYE